MDSVEDQADDRERHVGIVVVRAHVFRAVAVKACPEEVPRGCAIGYTPISLQNHLSANCTLCPLLSKHLPARLDGDMVARNPSACEDHSDEPPTCANRGVTNGQPFAVIPSKRFVSMFETTFPIIIMIFPV